MRGNKQIWAMTQWLYENVFLCSWEDEDQHFKNDMYDGVSEFLKKQTNHEFTGEDDHD